MRSWLGLSLAALVAGCMAVLPSLPLPPIHPKGQALSRIVTDKCLPDQRDHGDPAPCTQVDLAGGYVVLKDRDGASQFLVMPITPITGIEDPQVLQPGARDYFTPAWRTRALVAQRLGHSLARTDVSIAINSLYGRSQDLLHLHVDCLRGDVRATLAQAAPRIGYRWGGEPVVLLGHPYRAIRIDGEDRVASDPFRLLADGLHVPPAEMGGWTLVLAGMDYPDQRPGFVLLAARADPAAGYSASGEGLQDHACANTVRGPM